MRPDQWGVAYPTTFVLDAEGRVAEKRTEENYRLRESGSRLLRHLAGDGRPAPREAAASDVAATGVGMRIALDGLTYFPYQRRDLCIDLWLADGWHVYGRQASEGCTAIAQAARHHCHCGGGGIPGARALKCSIKRESGRARRTEGSWPAPPSNPSCFDLCANPAFASGSFGRLSLDSANPNPLGESCLPSRPEIPPETSFLRPERIKQAPRSENCLAVGNNGERRTNCLILHCYRRTPHADAPCPSRTRSRAQARDARGTTSVGS